MDSRDERIDALCERVGKLEDQLAIYQLIMTYGPSADSGSDDVVRAIHAEDAEYDAGVATLRGADGIGDMIANFPMHREIIAEGSAHLASMPVVHIEGDGAVAVFHGQVLRYKADEDEFRVWRATAVVMEFVRIEHGWRIVRRVNRLLDGSDTSHQHFRDGLGLAGALPAQ